MAKQVSLAVNGTAIEMNPFVAGLVESVVNGMVGSLRGTGQIDTLALAIDDAHQVSLNLNNTQVPLNPFVNKIFYSTIIGMVSSLKDVGKISSLKIDIKS